MDFCAALEQAIAKAPTSDAAEHLRRMLDECRERGGGVTTQDSGGGGTTNPPQPGDKPNPK